MVETIQELRGIIEDLRAMVLRQSQEIDFLKKENAALRAENAKLREENALLREENEIIKYRLNILLRVMFGQKSEKNIPEPPPAEEPSLEDPESALDDADIEIETITYQRKKPQRKGHHGIPANLPRKRIEYDIEEKDKICECGCNQLRRCIGEEITEQLEIIPTSIYVIQHVRKKYVGCMNSEKVILASMPAQPIAKCLAGPGLLADVIIKKYDDHLPLYRQSEIFARQGIDIARSTLDGWVMQCGSLLEPIVAEMKKDLLRSYKIHTDDTVVPVLDPGKKKTKTGRFWVYAGFGSQQASIIIYTYTATRSGKGPMDFLQGYKGYLQADAYTGYDQLFGEGSSIKEVACWLHARRGFFEIAKQSKAKGLAHEALYSIRDLYAIESDIKECTPDEKQRVREERAKPVLEKFKIWLDTTQARMTPKSPLFKAIQYTLNHWDALNVYVTDGELSIDNNVAERLMKVVAIGRKNWLFAGSDNGAKCGAILYSLIETCKANNKNPYEYLRDVLKRWPTDRHNKIYELLPYNWIPTPNTS